MDVLCEHMHKSVCAHIGRVLCVCTCMDGKMGVIYVCEWKDECHECVGWKNWCGECDWKVVLCVCERKDGSVCVFEWKDECVYEEWVW